MTVMERRTFLRNSSLAAASLLLPNALRAQSPLEVRTNAEALQNLEDKALTTIAFGSCNNTAKDLSYWSIIQKDNPDLWIWMGDNIYADLTTLKQREARYNFLKTYPLYQDFRAKTAVIGTWDDHDYGFNNSSGTYWSREQSQALFCDFMDIDKYAATRSQDGVYQSYVFGPAGQRTEVILLDLRYNMNNSLTHRELLGEDQWRWFEDRMKSTTADLLVIGSSLNVTSPVALLGLEGWTGYPLEKQRLYDALSMTDKPTVMLSGDRHFAELYRVLLPSGKVIHEAMSSGLTHSTGAWLPHPGRISPMIGSKNYGVLKVDWTGTGPVINMQIKSCDSYGVLAEALTRYGA
ncbi:MAG: alkaline phosphatase family protein [Proteobacteria bacterium]|nr:MAG: alkaline phosphatase family protein [Pseudomonadota bacterium]